VLSPGSGSQFPLERRVPAFTVQASADLHRVVYKIRTEQRGGVLLVKS
jgi:hypothetical protein